VVFSPHCNFKTDEIVLVSRSRGGFTYGKINKEVKLNCKITLKETHPLNAWRVIVSEENPGNATRKDLFSACIGKIIMLTGRNNPPKSRNAMFAECEEIPNPKMAMMTESEVLLAEEKALEEKSPIEDTNDECYLDEVIQLTAQQQDPVVHTRELKIINPTSPKSIQPSPLPSSTPQLQIGGIIAVDKEDLLRKLMKPKEKVIEKTKCLILVDGPNVARKHGKDLEFSTEGLDIVLKYWNSRGHDAIAFLPEHYVKRKPGQGPTVTLTEYMPKAKNLPLIMSLIEKGKVVLTPPQDYDDSYVIEYGMKHDACIVTNDRYWDHVEKSIALGKKAKKETLKWIREHLISFTFVRDDFLPNPDFKFPPRKLEEPEEHE